MLESNRLNLSLSGDRKKRRGLGDPTVRTILSLQDLRKRINSLEWDDFQKKALIKYASTFPEGSLDYIWRNLDHFLTVSLRKQGISDFIPQEIIPEIKIEIKEEKPQITMPTLELEDGFGLLSNTSEQNPERGNEPN